MGARRRRRLLRVRARGDRPAARHRGRLRRRARGPDRRASSTAASGTTSSAPSTSSATPPSTSRAPSGSTSGAAATGPTGSGSATSRRSPRRPGRASTTSWPTPTWSRSGAARGPPPERDPRHYYEPAVEAMLDAGVAMEMSTAGLRKPVGELYPAPALLEMAVDAGLPIALSSDAHVPDQLGYRYDDAVAALDRRRGDGDLRLRGPDAADGADRLMVRTGLGVDSHALRGRAAADPRRRRDPYEQGLAGHSDADVLTHAVIDALLGAAGLGDIGTALPRHRRAVQGRRLARAAARRRGDARRGGLGDRQRRRHRDAGAAQARCLTATRSGRARGRARRGRGAP